MAKSRSLYFGTVPYFRTLPRPAITNSKIKSNSPDVAALIRVFKLADSEHLMKGLLSDLLTEKEFNLIVRRLKAFILLLEGTPYSQIEWMTGLSSRAIARLSSKINDRNRPGGVRETLEKFHPHGQRYFE
jgi:uncharacterized protein YerC